MLSLADSACLCVAGRPVEITSSDQSNTAKRGKNGFTLLPSPINFVLSWLGTATQKNVQEAVEGVGIRGQGREPGCITTIVDCTCQQVQGSEVQEACQGRLGHAAFGTMQGSAKAQGRLAWQSSDSCRPSHTVHIVLQPCIQTTSVIQSYYTLLLTARH